MDLPFEWDWTPDLVQAAVELALRYGVKRTAPMFGLTYAGLQSALKRHGVPLPRVRRVMARIWAAEAA